MKSKLVLIEGLPGMGKTTTCKKLLDSLGSESWKMYLENSADCPLGTPWSFETAREVIEETTLEGYCYKNWSKIDCSINYLVESKFLQNAALFLFMKGCSKDQLLEMSTRILNEAQKHFEVNLIYLRSDSISDVLRQTIEERKISCPEWFPFVESLFREQNWYRNQVRQEESAFLQTMVAWSETQDWILRQLELDVLWVNEPQNDRIHSYQKIESFVGE